MNTTRFNERMKLADIICANPSLILMLPRFGIPLGFGDQTVQQVCRQHQVSADFVILIFNVYTFNDYLPIVDEMSRINMEQLVPYLEASHDYYLHQRLPHISRHLNHVAANVEPRYSQVLLQFMTDYEKDVTEHFEEEERNVFPVLQRLQQGEPTTDNIASRFVDGHSNIEDKLSDLTAIVYKYLPPSALPDESIELVFDILQLSADLEKHALIEEKILLPYANYLSGRKQ
ncbi:MAG: hemerythrin domain-containing protein [Bacteroidales bacterium]|nr:hemerythrin domain-containing protein [Bacteroidales bacterium]